MARIALCDASGPLTDLLQRLSGEDGTAWLRNLNKMLRESRGKRTVRDFKDFADKIWRRTGIKDHNNLFSTACSVHCPHKLFWKKLNELGAKNIKSQPPSTVPDIDDTVELSDDEWSDLEKELLQMNRC